MKTILLLCLIFTTTSFAQSRKARVRFEYKKYERFDFDALDVEGSRPSPGELSIPTRMQGKHKNKLPERKNFNREMKRAIDTVI
ncbi:MAG: hypothetical protein CME62_08370 [Halobacteriovoraceae bacterium]|nr:hypothetical protein [Halobacteriovoraceae bacterium]|tara:strand:+ start:4486 stop:4737 length:252 start_codon:yes stop_codon:yes gene_type:complete